MKIIALIAIILIAGCRDRNASTTQSVDGTEKVSFDLGSSNEIYSVENQKFHEIPGIDVLAASFAKVMNFSYGYTFEDDNRNIHMLFKFFNDCSYLALESYLTSQSSVGTPLWNEVSKKFSYLGPYGWQGDHELKISMFEHTGDLEIAGNKIDYQNSYAYATAQLNMKFKTKAKIKLQVQLIDKQLLIKANKYNSPGSGVKAIGISEREILMASGDDYTLKSTGYLQEDKRKRNSCVFSKKYQEELTKSIVIAVDDMFKNFKQQ